MNLSMNSRTRKGENKKISSLLYLQNGSSLLEKFISTTNGKHDVPIYTFSAKELIEATNNFSYILQRGSMNFLCVGKWEDREILVRKFYDFRDFNDFPSSSVYDTYSGSINDLVTTTIMSKHKNVLRISGCCLEFKYPVLVYQNSGSDLLLDLLISEHHESLLNFGQRLKIAFDIASAIIYLHTEFNSPIISRFINPKNVIIDQKGVAKIFDFSFSIALPPGKLQVEDAVIGAIGYVDPDYNISGIVTQKVDVYSFGVLLLVLLTGDGATRRDEDGEPIHIVEYVNRFKGGNQLKNLVDQRIMEEVDNLEQEEKLHAFLDLALRCVQDFGKFRPIMIDVAKELQQIRKR